MLYTTLQGSDLDEWRCPQLFLAGLGGMRGGGITEGDRRGGVGVG